MNMFKLKTDLKPNGDQPQAIKKLVQGFEKGFKEQILLGATGTGKTFTIANIIQHLQQQTLVIAHNKTLAGQLYNELKMMFPENKVEYFISYYDYYQPEAYVTSSDTYIEKDSKINDEIDQLRHNAIVSLLNRKDVIVVASVSCIYGVGDLEDYQSSTLFLQIGDRFERNLFLKKLVELKFQRNEVNFGRGTFRVRGDIVEIIPSSHKEIGIRIIFFGDEIERIQLFELLNAKVIENLKVTKIFPASLYAVNAEKIKESIKRIRQELKEQIKHFEKEKNLVAAQKIKMRTSHDLEMLAEMGHCSGIENYSRHLSLKEQGQPPSTLIDFFDKEFLTIIDESHVTVPQIKGMYFGDFSRKSNLVNYGFRLPSALDNRPLKFHEFEEKIDKIIYLSATPGDHEIERKLPIIEQIIRPTFVLDPEIEVKRTQNQMDDLYFEIKKRIQKNQRVLITTLTINMSEDLTAYLKNLGIKVTYLHSEIKSLQRLEILRDLRLGKYDCLVGVNLLREGLDLPEVSLVAILDADKQGFLRNQRSLIQTIGRAARNVDGKVIMYADNTSDAMKLAITETNRRRQIQKDYNQKNQLTPLSLKKNISESVSIQTKDKATSKKEPMFDLKNINQQIKKLTNDMKKAAEKLDFEKAASLRDLILELEKKDKKAMKKFSKR
ncbi:Helicase subunit of the DNA excision repair complex [Candidatus Phytoplasma australiense]|uniref:UvrABC system protein B n=2 Tax=Phytoplasma australiense TaxID=59748 RepID=B1VA15_PHYAS|nr:excinuclease ABC subunit UvrB [Candidatus Phytoplasma australiense]AGL90164.1 UvrABC system protein B [Strawberry lethal yellows phytoplasma (CPA) str. NZSb11]CAM11787.1 Helicase subunit of the DNA excision repair complex [Candidatus Phytoplasma australiense]